MQEFWILCEGWVWDEYDGWAQLLSWTEQRSDGIFVNHDKYITELIKKFGLEDAKVSKTPIAQQLSLIRLNKVKVLTLNYIIIWLEVWCI